jgi:hypothetical protein
MWAEPATRWWCAGRPPSSPTPPRGAAHPGAPDRVGVRGAHRPHPGVLRPGAGKQEQPGHHRGHRGREGERRAYKLGGAGGALTCFVKDGVICYEYTCSSCSGPRSLHQNNARRQTGHREPHDLLRNPAGGTTPSDLGVNGEDFAQGQVPISAPLLFSANECLDIGACLGSPVSMEYYRQAPFPFDGTIERMHVQYLGTDKAASPT